jgi:predicted nucleic acid-binding protein
MNNIAIDTNILLYSISKNEDRKLPIAANLMNECPVIFPQNLSEFINVLVNRWKYPKENMGLIVSEVLNSCLLINTSVAAYKLAFELIKKYDFQVFDAIIVASALEVGCNILFSEDMQDSLVIEKQLTIVNPFLV